jgi:hypothetical protein
MEYHPGIRMGASIKQVSLDIYIKDVNLALEYQGAHHYIDHPQAFGPAMMQEARDSEKYKQCHAAGTISSRANLYAYSPGLGITIVPIPFWWIPGDVETLGATIMHFRHYQSKE